MIIAKKIVFIGPESSGKTTLADFSANYFNEPLAHEFAREFLNNLNRSYTQDDLLVIAKAQIELEDQKFKSAKKFLICDTDLLVIKIWSEHLYPVTNDWIVNQVHEREYEHYFLCKNDFPWQADSLRENPELGDYFFNKFENALTNLKKSFTILEGSVEDRKKKITQILGELK